MLTAAVPLIANRLLGVRVAECLVVAAFLTAPIASAPAVADDTRESVTILFGAKGPYRVAAEAVAAQLARVGRECMLLELPEEADAAAYETAFDRLVKSKPALVATGGAAATAQAIKSLPETPVIFFLVPNVLDAPFLDPVGNGSTHVAGVASDVAPAEQMEWIKRTAPATKNVVLLNSPRTQRTSAALEKAGARCGITIRTLPATRDDFPAAIEALNQGHCDGVLMIPDAQVYNSPNVERLLLWGVRGRKPVWAFSENVVAAGAFAGLYCDPARVGRQTGELIQQVLQGAKIATLGVRYPRGIGVGARGAVNPHIAEMIGIPIEDSVLADGVVRVGGQP